LWFRAKRYGWGWTPVTWQGWAITIVYALAVAGWSAYEVVTGRRQPFSAVWPDLIGILLLTALLVAICWIKGERPRWRWGK
jgi:hypothetical protein